MLGFWEHFDDVKAEVEYTALVSVEVDLEAGDVASVGMHPTRDEDETPSEVPSASASLHCS
jgi:hypothetical protein